MVFREVFVDDVKTGMGGATGNKVRIDHIPKRFLLLFMNLYLTFDFLVLGNLQKNIVPLSFVLRVWMQKVPIKFWLFKPMFLFRIRFIRILFLYHAENCKYFLLQRLNCSNNGWIGNNSRYSTLFLWLKINLNIFLPIDWCSSEFFLSNLMCFR